MGKKLARIAKTVAADVRSVVSTSPDDTDPTTDDSATIQEITMSVPTSIARRAAVGTAALLGGVAGVQLGLALGAPWGAHVYGGRATVVDGVLAGSYRAASGAAAVLLLGAGHVVLARAGVVTSHLRHTVLRRGTWGIAAFLALNTLGNVASPSGFERWGMGAVTATAAVLAALVARSPRPVDAATAVPTR